MTGVLKLVTLWTNGLFVLLYTGYAIATVRGAAHRC